MEDLKDRFFEKLNEKYGPWDRNSARFGTFSYGEIADDLCISGSQFSKLLYGTATDGMYERTIKNIERLKQKEHLHLENSRLTSELSQLRESLVKQYKNSSSKYQYFLLFALLGGLLGYGVHRYLTNTMPENTLEQDKPSHFLADFYERDFGSVHVSPFLSSGEAQAFCPCSAFEGTWTLDKEYIIPVPIGKPGLYYLAKTSNIKMKCYRNAPKEKLGKVFLGFEDMKHELWLDTKREPFSPKYFNTETKNYTKEFYNIDFENDPTFKKVADIYAFMFDTFELEDGKILRKGEPSGRYANNINYELAKQYEIDVKDVMQNIIGNLVKTVCSPSINEYCNPNKLVENESIIKFDCNYTIKYENWGIGGSYPYSKDFRLIEQNYSDNLLCNCVE